MGERVYSVRMERVSPQHVRRYDNGGLVYEAIWDAEPSVPPEKVEYYDGKGGVIVRYRTNGDGTGLWTLFDDAGGVELELPEAGEQDRSQYGNWSRFIPRFARYEHSREPVASVHASEHRYKGPSSTRGRTP